MSSYDFVTADEFRKNGWPYFGPLSQNLPLFWTRFGPLAKSRPGNPVCGPRTNKFGDPCYRIAHDIRVCEINLHLLLADNALTGDVLLRSRSREKASGRKSPRDKRHGSRSPKRSKRSRSRSGERKKKRKSKRWVVLRRGAGSERRGTFELRLSARCLTSALLWLLLRRNIFRVNHFSKVIWLET